MYKFLYTSVPIIFPCICCPVGPFQIQVLLLLVWQNHDFKSTLLTWQKFFNNCSENVFLLPHILQFLSLFVSLFPQLSKFIFHHSSNLEPFHLRKKKSYFTFLLSDVSQGGWGLEYKEYASSFTLDYALKKLYQVLDVCLIKSCYQQ